VAAISSVQRYRAEVPQGYNHGQSCLLLQAHNLALMKLAYPRAGGMGEVYRARDTRLEREVALKLLPTAYSEMRRARARLIAEAKTASALNHPHICTIYDVGESAGQSYVAMEHVEGRPLSQQIPHEGLPLELVLRYGGQIADALAYAHEHGSFTAT